MNLSFAKWMTQMTAGENSSLGFIYVGQTPPIVLGFFFFIYVTPMGAKGHMLCVKRSDLVCWV